jgi:hypothetical protein
MQHKNRVKSRMLKLKSLGVATLLTCAFSLSTATAQESINATGGNALGSGGSVSYSVGQFMYLTKTGTNGSVAEGVQQPYEISVVTEIDEAKGINLLITASPNPTTDYLTLKIDGFDISNLSYRLFDVNGIILQNEKITGTQTSIVMSNLVPAFYFVTVIQENKEVKTFKIIKN